MKKFILCFLFLYVVFSGLVSAAEDDASIDMIFDKRESYNIHLSQGDDYNSSVIKDVQIVRFQDIGGRLFLVVKSKGLKISDEEGFILFDSITAILPDRNFNVQEIQKIYHINK